MKQSSIETEINRREVHVSEDALLLAEVDEGSNQTLAWPRGHSQTQNKVQ